MLGKRQKFLAKNPICKKKKKKKGEKLKKTKNSPTLNTLPKNCNLQKWKCNLQNIATIGQATESATQDAWEVTPRLCTLLTKQILYKVTDATEVAEMGFCCRRYITYFIFAL